MSRRVYEESLVEADNGTFVMPVSLRSTYRGVVSNPTLRTYSTEAPIDGDVQEKEGDHANVAGSAANKKRLVVDAAESSPPDGAKGGQGLAGGKAKKRKL